MLRPTIYALSSGAQKAGIAVIRISGPVAGACLEALTGALPPARVASLRAVRHPVSRVFIDHGLVLWFPGPRSATGEDLAELHLHGGRAVLKATFDALGEVDHVRPAEGGEFTRRAFENGKLDLTQVEGLADLINAETEVQRRQALRQAEGRLGSLYESWRLALIQAQGLVEAAIDFSDEGDVSQDAVSRAEKAVSSLVGAVSAHLKDAARGEIVRSGYRVVLAGPPNSGKSSLLNCLAQRDVAIVSAEPGTTRDVLDVHLDLDGYSVLISDTAGLRDAGGPIEQEGMRRALERAETADLIVWLKDATDPGAPAPPDVLRRSQVPILMVVTKMDLLQGKGPLGAMGGDLMLSSVSGAGVDHLMQRIVTLIVEQLGTGDAIPLTQARHRQALVACVQSLEAFLHGAGGAIEIRAENLRRAAHELGRLTGRVDVEDVLGEIFSRFCIGK